MSGFQEYQTCEDVPVVRVFTGISKRILNLTGQRFGRLIVIKFDSVSKLSQAKWVCRCDCGKEKVMWGGSLTSGKVVSCGCYRNSLHKTHGKSYSPEYRAWAGMIARCTNPKAPKYPNYGERGIIVCDKWLHSFESFYADIGDRPSKDYSLERLNVDGNYEPSNCIWATRREQQRNIRVQKNNTTGVNGVKKSLKLGQYIAQIRVERKTIHLGCFDSLVDAKNARHEAEMKYWGRVYIRPNEPNEPRLIEVAVPSPPQVIFCPYCGSKLLKFVKNVPRCLDCRAVFFIQFSRMVRHSPPQGLTRQRKRKEVTTET